MARPKARIAWSSRRIASSRSADSFASSSSAAASAFSSPQSSYTSPLLPPPRITSLRNASYASLVASTLPPLARSQRHASPTTQEASTQPSQAGPKMAQSSSMHQLSGCPGVHPPRQWLPPSASSSSPLSSSSTSGPDAETSTTLPVSALVLARLEEPDVDVGVVRVDALLDARKLRGSRGGGEVRAVLVGGADRVLAVHEGPVPRRHEVALALHAPV